MVLDKQTEEPLIDVLILEDDPAIASALQRVVEGANYSIRCSFTLADAIESANVYKPRLVLLDLALPDGDGLFFIDRLKEAGGGEVIIITASNNAELTRKCLKLGVFDFIRKPASSHDILRAIRRADGPRRVQQRKTIPHPSIIKTGFGSLIGSSAASLQMQSKINEIAVKGAFNALITGQPGVLKVDVAALLHQYSSNKGEALLINCASEDDVQASERFFGIVQSRDSAGPRSKPTSYLNSAQDGTLILDDLSALPLSIQRRLAIFIERGEVLAEQALTPTPHTCNVVGVLREPIETALSAGRLHEPLFYTLSTSTIHVPPLVERRDDIKFYAQQAIRELNEAYSTEKSLSTEFIDLLRSHYWPGNLVELKNCLFRAYQITENEDEIKPNGATLALTDNQVPNSIKAFVGQRFDEVEKQLIEATLAANENNKSRTAKVLGVSLKTLYNRLNVYSASSEKL